MKRGRPSLYTPEIAAEICERLADGEALDTICEDDRMPGASTVRRWAIEDREGFSAEYVRARQLQAYRWAEEILSIADDGRNDWYETEDGMSLAREHIQRSRLRVDTRKWLLSKLLPKEFGDKVELAHSGSIDTGVLRVAERATPEDWQNRVKALQQHKNGDGAG